MKNQKRSFLFLPLNYIIFIALIPSVAFSTIQNIKTEKADELIERTTLLEECQNNKKYIEQEYTIDCKMNYHHYNSTGFQEFYDREKAIQHGEIKIAEFNALHPGMGKSRFKDYKKVAQILNEFDVIGVTELIPLVGEDYAHNQALLEFRDEAPEMIQEITNRLNSLKLEIENSTRGSTVKQREFDLYTKKREQLQDDFIKAKNLKYRTPGYLKILNKLHKLPNGKEWSLILSPRGEAAETSPTAELVGYYYRSSIVRPEVNPYCNNDQKWGNSQAFACIINMDANDFDEDKSEAFSRRPFLAEFLSGDFSFTLVTSHILFQSPSNPDHMKFIMNKAFGVNTYVGLGQGLTKSKYARFAEIKMTLDFIKRYLDKNPNHQKDIIYMGDFNLEMDNPFWKTVLESWQGSRLFISDETSLTAARFNKDGSETYGKSSNYDHFIFNPHETSECLSGQTPDQKLTVGRVYDFTRDKWSGYLNRMYKVREDNGLNFFRSLQTFDVDDDDEIEEEDINAIPYANYGKDERKYNRLIRSFVTSKMNGTRPTKTIGRVDISIGKHSITSRGIINDTEEDLKYAKYFKERVLDSQLSDDTYYYYFQQLLSDHYPIYMSCSTR